MAQRLPIKPSGYEVVIRAVLPDPSKRKFQIFEVTAIDEGGVIHKLRVLETKVWAKT